MQTQKRYFTNPNRKSKYEDGFPKSFQPLFVFKETGTSILLAGSDVLDGSVKTNESKINGWIKIK